MAYKSMLGGTKPKTQVKERSDGYGASLAQGKLASVSVPSVTAKPLPNRFGSSEGLADVSGLPEAMVIDMIPEVLAGGGAYSGIGSRETPSDIMAEMTEIASVLEGRNMIMRSGGAQGADSAFEDGIQSKQNKEVFIPWKGFQNSQDGVLMDPSVEAKAHAIVMRLHPAPDRLSSGALRLHTRNVSQVLGQKLDSPVKAVICWTPNGADQGGTGMAIRIADEAGIPVINMRRPEIRKALLAELGLIRERERSVEKAETKDFKLDVAVRTPRTWDPDETTVFFRVAEENGCLSNMGNKFPYKDQGYIMKSSEHQYQAAPFSRRPDIQEEILSASTAMDSKKVAREYSKDRDPNWIDGGVNVEMMAYVVTRRAEAHPEVAKTLENAWMSDRPVVEKSSRDDFWGAKPQADGTLKGRNVLGGIYDEFAAGARSNELPKSVSFPTADELNALRAARKSGNRDTRPRTDAEMEALIQSRAAAAAQRSGSAPAKSAGPAATAKTGANKEPNVTYIAGDITKNQAQVLVNTVNSRLAPSGRGVMGAGVAKAFKNAFPSIMKDYEKAIRSGELRPGTAMLFDLPDGRKWAALATKDDWKNPSQMKWVEDGLKDLAKNMKAAGLTSVAIPPPGCGNGGLNWEKVRPLVLEHLSDFDLNVYGTGPVTQKHVDRQMTPGVRSGGAKEDGSPSKQASSEPEMKASMYFSYGRSKRPEIEGSSTFEAILDGQRTSTTRYDEWRGSDRWGKLEKGAVVRFFEDKEMKGRSVDVAVQSVERVKMSEFSPERIEEWSKAEGWSVDFAKQSAAKHGAGFQVRYEVIPGQEIVRQRQIQREENQNGDLVALMSARDARGR